MENSNDIAQFIGRFHILLLHIPVGLLLLLGFLELLSLRPVWRHATSANRYILALTAPVAVATAGCGWLLAGGDGYDERLLFLHRWTGVGVAASACVLLFVHTRGWLSLYRPLMVAAVVFTVLAGHFGAALTHGSGYLIRYAPAWLVGTRETESKQSDNPARFASVEPVFADYCIGCHGPEKSKAGLRLDSLENLLAGGDSGPVIVPGDAEGSLLLTRILLALDEDDHMPPAGKPQPAAEQVEQLRSWIATGVVE